MNDATVEGCEIFDFLGVFTMHLNLSKALRKTDIGRVDQTNANKNQNPNRNRTQKFCGQSGILPQSHARSRNCFGRTP